MELEAQVRGHIGVRQLLVREHDVEPDGLRADVRGTAIRGLHERRPAARADDELALAVLVASAIAGQSGELPGDVIIRRLGLQPLGDRALLVIGRRRDQRIGHVRRGHPRRSVEHERRPDPGFVEEQLGLQQLELEADRAQILAQQELAVLEGELVRRAFGLRDRRDMLGRPGIDLGGREDALGRMRLIGHCRRLAANDDSVTMPDQLPFARPSRSAESRTSPRPARRTAAASRSATRRLQGSAAHRAPRIARRAGRRSARPAASS